MRKCRVLFPSLRVAAPGLRVFGLLGLFSMATDRRASTALLRRLNRHGDTKKRENKLRLTSLRVGTIAACVWKRPRPSTTLNGRACLLALVEGKDNSH